MLVPTLFLVACDNNNGSRPLTPAALCRRALGSGYLNAGAAKVKDIRTLDAGPARTPWKDAFPKAKADDPAAWCWTGAPHSYVLYAVGPSGEHIQVEEYGGANAVTVPKPVRPAIP